MQNKRLIVPLHENKQADLKETIFTRAGLQLDTKSYANTPARDLLSGGEIEFKISDGSVDSHGDIVQPKGAKLENFEKNPVVLFAHMQNQPPVAKAKDTALVKKRGGDYIKSTAVFPSVDIYEFGNQIFRLLAKKYLNASSVGFLIKEYEPINGENPFGAWNIKEWELFEYSVVPVPANPNALVKAATEMDRQMLKRTAEHLLDLGNFGIEEAYRKLFSRKLHFQIPTISGIKKVDKKKEKNEMSIETRDHDEELEIKKMTQEDPVVLNLVGYNRPEPVEEDSIFEIDEKVLRAELSNLVLRLTGKLVNI